MEFVKSDFETVAYYPLEKRSVFSEIEGELGLKIWYVDDPPEVENTDEPEKDKTNENTPKEKPTVEKPKEEILEETTSPKQELSNPSIVQTEKPKQGNERHHEVLKCEDLNVRNGEMRSLSSDRSRNAYDLVDPMPFLYVRVVKTKRARLETGSTVYANLSIGTRSVKTKSEIKSKDWDQVLAFDKEAPLTSSFIFGPSFLYTHLSSIFVPSFLFSRCGADKPYLSLSLLRVGGRRRSIVVVEAAADFWVEDKFRNEQSGRIMCFVRCTDIGVTLEGAWT
ncbi:uncharacterized protein HKW66_Vig0048180 [Vigna angularis]|uniref:C2 domain-containing protein n=1 Tax=Phaseolus angularis TaxID=3914 RepID=A0A8T0L5I2_PHAAN|nr:uncharacterized protein HKW66_Vig0048180 [Vigna angularis]